MRFRVNVPLETRAGGLFYFAEFGIGPATHLAEYHIYPRMCIIGSERIVGITGQSLPDPFRRRAESVKTTHDHSAQ